MRWLAFLRRGRRDREIAEEIAAHLEMATRDRIEHGESPADARFAAMRELGNLDQVREETRRVWTSTAVEQLLQDSASAAASCGTRPASARPPCSSSRSSSAATRPFTRECTAW